MFGVSGRSEDAPQSTHSSNVSLFDCDVFIDVVFVPFRLPIDLLFI
jgi:hypothetical protein